MDAMGIISDTNNKPICLVDACMNLCWTSRVEHKVSGVPDYKNPESLRTENSPEISQKLEAVGKFAGKKEAFGI